MNRRSLTFGLALFGAVLSSIALGSASGAQDIAEGDVRVLVTYPDGSLVQDTTVCVNGYRVGDDGRPAFWFTETEYNVGARAVLASAGPDSTYSLPAESVVAFAAFACDQRDSVRFVTGYQSGPEPRWGLDESFELMRDVIRVVGGQTTTVTIVVGDAMISGTSPGHANGSCGIYVLGSPTIGHGRYRQYATATGVQADGSWSARVPPGEYQVAYQCPGGAEYWPESTRLESAGTIRVGHRGHVRNINFSQQQLDLAGTGFEIMRDATSSMVTVCIDVVDGQQRTISRIVRQDFRDPGGNGSDPRMFVRVPNGAHKLRFWDCGDGTFDDVWYPNGTDFASGQTIVGGTEVTDSLPEVVRLFGDTGLRCAGRVATLIGSASPTTMGGTPGDDVIVTFDSGDVVVAGEGDDLICTRGGADTVYGGPGRDVVYAGHGNDTVLGQGDSDRLRGGHGQDRLFGGANSDRLWGDRNSDMLDGGLGNDRLIGGAGSDTLIGNRGRKDNLVGGGNIDVCIDAQPTTRRTTCEADS